MKARQTALLVIVIFLSACGRDPGPLRGTWNLSGPVPMTITFRVGESEAMGIIEKVSYKIEGDSVLVTYEEGTAKGTTMRYTMQGSDVAHTGLGTFRRAGSNHLTQEQLSEKKKQSIAVNTICAYNSDKDKCSCYHKENGMKISKSKSDCIDWARDGVATDTQ